MKKILLYCTLSVMLLACHKDNKPSPPPNNGNKTYAVHFNVSASGKSSLNTNGLHTNDATPVPISSFATKLYYWVYNSSGKLITQLVQDTSTANFGQITDTFAPGNYNIVLVAQNIATYTGGKYLTAPTTFSSGYFSVLGNDTFFDTFPLTVSSSPITQNITLTRDVGQLQIILTDSIPSNAKILRVDINPVQSVKVSNGATVSGADSGYHLYINLPDSLVGKKNFTVTTYIPNLTTVPFKITLTATTSTGTAVAMATIDSVTTTVNQRTIVSGNLFPHLANIGFTVTINDAWDTDPIIIPFNQRLLPNKKVN